MNLRVLLSLALVVAVVAAYAATGSSGTAGQEASRCGAASLTPDEMPPERTRELTLCLLNEERAARGLPALRREARLELASQRHSEDMVRRRFFEHDAPSGIEPHERMLATGYPANNAITGENIAWGTGSEASPAQIVDSWMHSKPHRESILRPQFTEIGVGVAPGAPRSPRSTDPPFTYTTDFGGPPPGL